MLKRGLRRLFIQPWVQKTIAVAGANYIRLISNTSRMQTEEPVEDIYAQATKDLPVIIAMWHGQHLLMPLVKQEQHRAKVLISHHRDGALNAAVAEQFGVEVIRGSGTHGGDFHRKGGVSAFKEMLESLEEGYSVAMTADIPKVSRVCGLGIIKLASLSGRPIYPVAIATYPRYEMNTWDRTAFPLPFGRSGYVAGTPIRVLRDADTAQLEAARLAVESALNAATRRAYELADRKGEQNG